MDLLLGEAKEKNKTTKENPLGKLSHIWACCLVRVGQNLILLFPTFDPAHLEIQFESNRRKFSFLFQKLWEKNVSHLASTLLAKTTNIHALVGNYKT